MRHRRRRRNDKALPFARRRIRDPHAIARLRVLNARLHGDAILHRYLAELILSDQGMETPTPVISRKRVTMPRTVRGAANAVGFSGFGITPKAAWRCSPASTRKPMQRNAS